MDLVCQRMLNQGFLKVERYHNLCQKQVKAQLPRYAVASDGSNLQVGIFVRFLVVYVFGIYVISTPNMGLKCMIL